MSSDGRCMTAKKCYSTREYAKRANRRIAAAVGGDRDMVAYRCGRCTFWHLGHAVNDDARARYRERNRALAS